MGGRDAEAQAWVQCSTAQGALGPTCPAPTEGRVWGRGGGWGERGQSQPHPAGVSAPRPAPAPSGDLGEVRKTAAPRPLPECPRHSLQPPKRGGPPRRAALTHRAAGHPGAAGWLPPPGWAPGVSTELCRAAPRGEVGWAAGRGDALAQQRAQLTPRTLAAPSTGSS